MTLGAARVIYQLNDLSQYVDQITPGYVIVLCQTQRGPVWNPTPVASQEEFERQFGTLWEASVDPLGIETGLQSGAKFVIIRCVHCTDIANPETMTAQCATATLMDRGSTPTHGSVVTNAGPWTFQTQLPGTVTGSEVGPFTFGNGTADALQFRVGNTGSWGTSQTVTLTGSLQTAAQVASQLNAGSTGVSWSATPDGRVQGVANVITNSLEVQAVANDACSVLGLLEQVYPSVAGSAFLSISIDGGSTPQNFTLTPASGTSSTFTLTNGQVMTQLASISGATLAAGTGTLTVTSSSSGTGSTVQIMTGSTAATVMGLDNSVHSGASGADANTLQVTSANPGVWGAAVNFLIQNNPLNPSTQFDIAVRYDNQPEIAEFWGGLNMIPGDPYYAPTYVNPRSELIQLEDLESPNPSPQNRPAVNTVPVYLVGGNDGLEGWTDADWIGDELAKTGMFAADAITMGIDIMVPGSTSVTVMQELATYCENRGDLVAYGQMPGMDPNYAVDWRMGQAPYMFAPFNSNRLALFYGWPLVYDESSNTYKNIPNLWLFASRLAMTDVDYDQSFAPVGPRRGLVSLVYDLDFNMYNYPGLQDDFANNQINYLEITPTEGAVFWEERTTQLITSALQDLNVVRFLTMMQRALMPVLRTFVFEPNHPNTWREFQRTIDPWLEGCKNKGQIYDYELQSDENAYFDNGVLKNAVMNTGLNIDQHIYNARVLIQPTRAIFYVCFTVGVMKTGESFMDYDTLYTLPGIVSN